MQSPANIRHAGVECLKLPVRQQSAIENELHRFFCSTYMKSAVTEAMAKVRQPFCSIKQMQTSLLG